MSENVQAGFLFLFMLLASLASQNAGAAYVTTPAVEGLSAGSYKPLTMPALVGENFSATGRIWVNGKNIPIPGFVPPAATAAEAAKRSLWLNPWLVGAGLLTWAGDAGLGSDQVNGGGWTYSAGPDPTSTDASCSVPNLGISGYGPTQASACQNAFKQGTNFYVCPAYNPQGGNCYSFVSLTAGYVHFTQSTYCTASECVNGKTYGELVFGPNPASAPAQTAGPETAQTETRPATEADFLALPPPPAQALAELAPQVGVPVDAPVYEPIDVAIGDPYTKPDGSTAEPRAKISPQSGGQVAVDTYDQPLTTPTGDPVTNPTPEDTPESTPTETQCDKYPDTLGCSRFGDIPAPDSLTTLEIPASTSIVPIGGAGSCPADVTTTKFGITWSYQPICDFASAVRPFIIGFAWLAFAYIVAGTVRT